MYHDGIGELEELGKRQGFSVDELDEIINGNSLLPLKEPFQHPRVQGSDKHRIWGNWRGMVRLGQRPTYKVCPICYLRDLETKGEGYLRIHHQAQGVLVCAEHKVDLIERLYNPTQLEVICLENIKITRRYFVNKNYGQIAVEVADILQHNLLNELDAVKCYEKYKKRICDTYGIEQIEVIGHQELHLIEQELILYYGETFLESVGCGKDGKVHYNWFISILTNKNRGYGGPKAIQHLLVIQFLFGDLQVFKEYSY